VILDGEKERQGDYVFTANEVGEYRFCFDNSVSTFSDKLVDFEIAVRTHPTSHRPSSALLTETAGRRRTPSQPPAKDRRIARTAVRR